MVYYPERDFVGYANRPLHPKWPGDQRLALNIVLNYEEGSEASFDRDSKSEYDLTEVGMVGSDVSGRDIAAEQMFEYGSRVGFWRLQRIFKERNLPVTIFACAEALAKNPLACQEIIASDYDICCHGNRWAKHYLMSADEEREQIKSSISTLTQLFGNRPAGWYCRYSPSINTRRLIVEEGGFLYDSDSYNDDIPYWVNVDNQKHLVIPYSLCNNDTKFIIGNLSTSRDYFEFIKDAFDTLYEEGKDVPKMMSIGIHMRILGHPARSKGLEQFLDYILTHKDLWIARRIDIAKHWHENHK